MSETDGGRGYEAATSRWRELSAGGRRGVRLRRLVWVVAVSSLIWVLSSAGSSLLYLQVSATLFEGTGLFDTLFRWSQLISVVVQPLTLGGFAVYVVLWLDERRGG